jgi:hypothetical protein
MKKDSAIRMLFDCLPVENENLNLESIMNKILFHSIPLACAEFDDSLPFSGASEQNIILYEI